MEPPTAPDSELEKQKKISTPSVSDDGDRVGLQLEPGDSDIKKEHLTGAKVATVVGTVTIVTFLALIDQSIIVTAIPSLTDRFHSLSDVGWYGGAYALANATLQPLTGKLYTYFRNKWLYLACFAVFELGSLICGVASSSRMLILGRAVAGLGSAGLQNGGLMLIAGVVPLERRPAMQGICMGGAQLGLVLGPVLGGLFTQYVSWRWCFYINLPVGGVAVALLLFFDIPDHTPKDKFSIVIRNVWGKLDLFGFVVFASASIMFLLALQYGGVEHPWDSATVIGLLCGAGATYIVFFLWERRMGNDAMIPISMISKRIVWCSCLVMAFLISSSFLVSYYLPIYFQTVKGRSPTMSGVNLLPNILFNLVFAVWTGIMITKIGYYYPFGILSAVLVSISNGLFSTFSPSTPLARQVGIQILLGAGLGSGIQVPIVAAQNAVPESQTALALSLVMFSQTFMGSIMLTAANTILSNSLKTKIPHYAPLVDLHTVLAAGATGVRKAVSGAELVGVVHAYSDSIDRVFYLTAGGGVCCFICAWGLGWKDIRKKKPPPTPA